MRLYNNILNIILAVAVLLFTSCSKQEHPVSGAAEEAMVTFCPKLSGNNSTKTIGDATGINRLKVAVYEIIDEQSIYRFTHTENNWNRNSLSISLLKGRNYKLLFWADNSNNNAYSFNPENGYISADYSNYSQGGFTSMEQLDAFYAAAEIQNVKTDNIDIDLIRPLAQLNFVDKTSQPVAGTHTATLHIKIPTQFNLFSGETGVVEELTFQFADFTTELLNISDVLHHYLATNYILAPTGNHCIEITGKFILKSGETTIKELEFTDTEPIKLQRNYKTNIIGEMLVQP